MPTNLQPLIDAWKIAKETTDKAKADQLAVETSIITALGDELKKGTNNFGELKIQCANSRKFNQLEIVTLRNQWPQAHAFPFETEYVADNKAIAYFEKSHPEIYEMLKKTFVDSGKKPAFSIKEGKGE